MKIFELSCVVDRIKRSQISRNAIAPIQNSGAPIISNPPITRDNIRALRRGEGNRSSVLLLNQR